MRFGKSDLQLTRIVRKICAKFLVEFVNCDLRKGSNELCEMRFAIYTNSHVRFVRNFEWNLRIAN